MKLIVDFAIIFLGLERPGRIGVMYLEIKASIFGGVTLPRKYSRQMCAATEKLYITSRAKISWSINSTFLE
jgi:hypothetical protein